MSQAERLALAILRGGLSYEDAARQSRLPVQQVIDLWKRSETLEKQGFVK